MLRSLTLAVLALGASLAAQQPTTFKGGTRTVAVYATVTDPSGRLVPDLERDRFEVYDNGKRQDITVFANDVQPITVVVMLDRSGSMRANFGLVARAAEQFVIDLQPADKARIGSFSDRIQVDPRDFTSDRGELIAILRTELQEAGPTPLWNAVNVGITALLHQQGRRVVLVFTDGVDRPMNSSSSSLKDVMKRAGEEDVMVYAIGLAGRSFGGGRRGGGAGGGFGRGGHGRGGRGGGFRRPWTDGGQARRGSSQDRGRDRRRLLRADVDRRSLRDVRARGRGASSSIRAGLHADRAGRQDP